jgi:hypothetical protein
MCKDNDTKHISSVLTVVDPKFSVYFVSLLMLFLSIFYIPRKFLHVLYMSLSYFYLVLQIAPYDQLQMIERLVDVPKPSGKQA